MSVGEYRVEYTYKGEREHNYIQALSAQQAVDFLKVDGMEILEVCLVVTDWKPCSNEVNIAMLKGKMVEKGINAERLAEAMGIDRATLYRKFDKAEKITIGEAMRIKAILGLTDQEAYQIFFGVKVA